MGDAQKVKVVAEIDRGLSFSLWKELEAFAVQGPFEKSGIGDEERHWDIVRVDYSVLDDLRPGDSVYIPGHYGNQHTRTAALNKAAKRGWSVTTKKTYENDKLGLRIFRLS